MIKLSRSHIETFFECPRKFWLRYYEGGTGIVTQGKEEYLWVGDMVHAMLAAHMLGRPLPQFGESPAERLALALSLAWIEVRGPVYQRDYDVISVEKEVEIEAAPGVVLMSRVDCVVRRKSDGLVFAGPEWKTTGMFTTNWMESWRYSSQTLSHMLDVKKATGQEGAGVLMEFIYKGRKNNKGAHQCALLPPDDRPVAEWLASLPMDQKTPYFASREVWRSPDEVEEFTTNVVHVGAMLNHFLDQEGIQGDSAKNGFRPRLDQHCYSNKYGHKCPYLPICYREVDDPVGSGMYVARVPHHFREFMAYTVWKAASEVQ